MKLHLPKGLYAALIAAMAVILPSTYGADAISINFSGNGHALSGSESGELGGVAASGWMNVGVGDTTGTALKNQNGELAGTLMMSGIMGSWQSNVAKGDAPTVTSVVQKGYIDVANYDWAEKQVYTISVDHNYWLADLTFYMSNDVADAQYSSVNVNGVSYQGGTNVKGSGAWGTTGNPAGVVMYDASNSITITAWQGDFVVKNDFTGNNTRATMAGMQIKDTSEIHGYLTTLGSGVTTVADATWSLNGTDVSYADIPTETKNLGITASEQGSGLKLQDGDAVTSIAAMDNKTTLYTDSTVVVDRLYVYDGAEMEIAGTISAQKIDSFGVLSIASGGILKLAPESLGTALPKLSGSGRIEVSGDSCINGNAAMGNAAEATKVQFAGTIAMDSSSELALGSDVTGAYDHAGWAVEMKDATIEINGGGLRFNGDHTTVGKLHVKSDDTLQMYDSYTASTGLTINEVQLDGRLSVTMAWKGTLNIGVLTGDDKLSVDHGGITVNVGGINSGAGIIKNAATMNLGAGADSTLYWGNTLTNTGTISVTGVITISDSLDGFVRDKVGEAAGLSVNGTDGYEITSGSTYFLLKNEGGTVSSFVPKTALYKGENISLGYDENTGMVTFVGGSAMDTIYRVNTQDVTVGGTSATENTNRATAFMVASGRTVTIAGGADNATASELLLGISGNGGVNLSTDVKLSAHESTQAKGALQVQGAKLHLAGGNDYSASVSSFSAIILDDAIVDFDNNSDTFSNVTVTKAGASMELYDMGAASDAFHWVGKTMLSGDLKITSTYNSQMVIDNLSGSGKVVIDDDGRAEQLVIDIKATDAYTGQVQVKQNYANLTLNVAENANVNVVYDGISGAELNVQSIKTGNKVTLTGITGYLTQNSNIAADVEIQNSADGKKAGFEINEGYSNSTNTFAGKVTGTGNFVITKVGLTNFTQKFTGDISGWSGRLDLAGGSNQIEFTGDASTINIRQIEVRNHDTAQTTPSAHITLNHAKAVTVNSEILQTAGTISMTVSNSSAQGVKFTNSKVTLSDLHAQESTKVAFEALETLSLNQLTLEDGANIVVKTLSATESILHGGATVTGNFDLSRAKTLTLDGLNNKVVTVTGALTITPGESLTLMGEILDSIAALESGERLDIFKVDGGLVWNGAAVYSADSAIGEWAINEVFANNTWTDGSELFVGYDGTNVYIVNMVIPEPTTATLSLMALAALAARRRRK